MFNDMISDMISTKKTEPIITQLFFCLIIYVFSFIFITELCSAISKNIRLNSTNHFITKVLDKREL